MNRKEFPIEIAKTQVLVLAGGKAKRMGVDFPKCLLEISGKKLIDRCIESLKKEGFREFIFLLGDKHELVMQHIGDGSKHGIEARFSIDPDSKLGWSKDRSLKYALQCNKIDRTRRSIIVFPNDLVLEKNFFSKFMMAHLDAAYLYGTFATIALVPGTMYPYCVASVDDKGRVLGFTERPYVRKSTSVGIYVFEPRVYRLVEEAIDFSIEDTELEASVLHILARQKRLFSFFVPDNKWLPINTLKEYEDAIRKNKELSTRARKKNYVLPQARVHEVCKI